MSSNFQGEQKIHQYLNAKMSFANWEADVFLILAVFCGFAVIAATSFYQLVLFIVLGVVLAVQYQSFKDNNVRGFFQQVLYYFGMRKFETLPPSNVRHFFG